MVTDFAALVRAFKNSPKFRGYRPTTAEMWGRELEFMCRPNCLGEISLKVLRPALVQAYMDGLEGRPGKQANALGILRQMERWAIARDLLGRPITMGVEIERMDGGHTPWSEADVARAEQFAKPFIARVVTLGANTGQRGSDLIRMGPTDVETYEGIDGINVTQQKTGRKVWVPINSRLAEVLKTWERRLGPWLRDQDDQPFRTRKRLTDAWTYERDHNRNLEELKRAGLVLHGLRGCACVNLLRAGANTRQISDVVGMSEPMVARYTKLSAQRENATAAIIHLNRTISERERTRRQKGVS